LGLDDEKLKYLEKQGLKFHTGFNQFETACEFCGKKLQGSLRVSKNGRAYQVSCRGGEFHHDAQGNLHLYCYECHKRIHDWGVIQRWLNKIGKTVDDLPDASKLRPMMKFRW